MPSLLERLLSKIEIDPSGCWLFTGCTQGTGYGVLRFGGRKGKNILVHRLSFELFKGPLPEGYNAGHMCHDRDLNCPGGKTCKHRRCIHPDHLEPQTQQENVLKGRGGPAINARKDKCKNGHPFVVVHKNGKNRYRDCLICRRLKKREARQNVA